MDATQLSSLREDSLKVQLDYLKGLSLDTLNSSAVLFDNAKRNGLLDATTGGMYVQSLSEYQTFLAASAHLDPLDSLSGFNYFYINFSKWCSFFERQGR